jgi:DNA gyrase/topoisomerase IV subunit A
MSNKKNTPVAVGELTADELKALKEKYGRLRKITVTVGSETLVAYCKYPDRNTIAVALSKRGQNKVLEAGETILDNCLVHGDEQFKTSDAVRMAAAMECYELIDFLPVSSEEV